MADYIIIIATLSALASAGSSGAPGTVPDRVPTLGFHVYPSLEACTEAVASNAVPAGKRLVCVPTEAPPGGLIDAH